MSTDLDTRRLTTENLSRALDLHQSWGAITQWSRDDTRKPARWVIVLAGPSGAPVRTLGLHSKRDIGLIVAALNAAHYAATRAAP